MANKAAAALLITAVLAVGCGNNHVAQGPPATSAAAEDPALTAAAQVVQPVVVSFPAFAGTELRHEVPMLVVYRTPDPALDAAAVKAAPNTRIEFRDAAYTHNEMIAAAALVMGDREDWGARGWTIASSAPMVDGSGVLVVTTNDPSGFADALQQRYPNMRFSAQEGGEVVPPVYNGPAVPLTIPPTS
ncbi:hypothetical protein ACOBQX_26185 [Actinokineospora sp. G85]|uniref:hypothetical protein n=1 Tax=Actinokineospora sp. G85 TaxID=3406626 RepID=UPI003C72D9D0